MEIAFRLIQLDDGQVSVDCRVGAERHQGLSSGWSHMTTQADEIAAAGSCETEILYQLGLLHDEDADEAALAGLGD